MFGVAAAAVAGKDTQAMPDPEAVAFAAETIRSCDQHVAGLEQDLVERVGSLHRRILHVAVTRELMPDTNRKTKRMPEAKKRSGGLGG